jgi:hypothetical protein
MHVRIRTTARAVCKKGARQTRIVCLAVTGLSSPHRVRQHWSMNQPEKHRVRPVSLIQALWQVVPWQIRRPGAQDVTLLHDAEFQIMLRELRYPPIRGLYDASITSVGSPERRYRKR